MNDYIINIKQRFWFCFESSLDSRKACSSRYPLENNRVSQWHIHPRQRTGSGESPPPWYGYSRPCSTLLDMLMPLHLQFLDHIMLLLPRTSADPLACPLPEYSDSTLNIQSPFNLFSVSSYLSLNGSFLSQ